MPQHVRVHIEGHPRRLSCPLDHSQEPSRGHWRSTFCREDIRARSL
jgi:hypothetical protein